MLEQSIPHINLAVLPFANLSPNPEHEYFSDGISESIMTLLSRFQEFRITARTSSFAFKNKTIDARLIGQQLNVAYFLEGSVRHAGEWVRISTQLIDTKSGFQIWAEQFDRKMEDVFSVQDEIAGHIASQLKKALGKTSVPKLSPVSTSTNMQAYQAYLKGNFYFNKHTPEGLQSAIEQYKAAQKADPNYALAYCGLANCYFHMANWGWATNQQSYPMAKKMVKKALSLDPNLVEAHVRLAMIQMYYEHNWERAGISFGNALKLNREFPTVYSNYAWYLAGLGYYSDAIEVMQKALEYNPLSLILHHHIGDLYRYKEHYDQAIAQYRKVLVLDPNFRISIESIGISYILKGDYDKGIHYLREYKSMVKHPLGGNASLGFGYGFAGREKEALECLDAIKKRAKLEPNRDFSADIFSVTHALGLEAEAMEYLSSCFQSGMGIIYFLCDPIIKSLRRNRKYQDLWKSINFGTKQTPLLHEILSKDQDIMYIQSEIKEKIQIKRSNFLYAEAQNNYCRIVWQEQNVLKEKLLRISLSNLAAQIEDKNIRRCHRSYLVNLKTSFKISGNAKGYRLRCSIYEYEIPVSRSLANEIINQLDN